MKNTAFLAQLLATPWAMQPEVLSAYAGIIARRYAGEPAAAIQAAKPSPTMRQGSIAVIPVHGAIMQRANMMQDMCGGTSTDQVSSMLRQALADETVSKILLDIDSPGGSVYGTGELAAEIYQARAQKPVVAFANSLAASAAYWIGCSASEFYVTPGGEVGSIGVWMAHDDYSQAMAESGVKTTIISAGKFKVEGNPYEPLGEDAQAFMQSRVSDYYQSFTAGVAKGRGVPIESVRSGMGQGRCLGADQALSENMVDGVMTLNDVIKKMQRSAKPSNLRTARNSLALIE